ncbi:UxaA family hydrolase [Acinetobacter gyllenbergii]|uniref:UxaA family hydrolase n=1 Tax=Acinetobacter gyllenbergii TaxID=134534 RepID=UPI003F54DD70
MINKSNEILKLNNDDNIAIARVAIDQDQEISTDLKAIDDIPAAHKIAVKAILKGEPVRRYGQIIGFASQNIAVGAHVHTHNLAMANFDRDYAFSSNVKPVKATEQRTFLGIKRADGRVATRNYIGVISTVNCSATVVKKIAQYFDNNNVLKNYPNIDGVVALSHSFGCCIDHHGEGLQQLRRTIKGYMEHANFAGVLIVGLGCEANQLKPLLAAKEKGITQKIQHLIMQEEGGTQKTIDKGILLVKEMLTEANNVQREVLPLSHLCVALQCGGSDGYSGITANPALGVAVDHLVKHGGTAILSETPEIYGAEHLLTQRAINAQVGEKLVALIHAWENYAEREKGSIDNNPTPGNKAGGLTTILEKSLGAVAKSGSTPLNGVYKYAEPIDTNGLVFMDAPGYDPMGATGQIASGANLVAFTTGRGSCFGAKPAPSIKIATNSKMYEQMLDDMDINCGNIMDGTSTVEEKGLEIFEMLIRVASGIQSKSEVLGIGGEEFVPWMVGAQM